MANRLIKLFFCLLCLSYATNTAHGKDRPANPGAISGEVLLQLRSADDIESISERYPVTPVDRLGTKPIFRVRATGDVTPLLESMALDPAILIAEPNFVQELPEAARNNAWAVGEPGDYRDQWALPALRVPAAQLHSLGAGSRVAVIDTGVDTAHPALSSRLLPGIDFIDGDDDPSEVPSSSIAFGHGTHVAGIIGAVAPQAAILPIRVLDSEGRTDAWTLLRAVQFAVDPDGDPQTDDGAHVINLSLGTTARTEIFDTLSKLAACAIVALQTDPDGGGLSDPGYDADRGRCTGSRGAVVVAAAGNFGSKRRFYPAGEGAYGLLAVTATDPGGTLASFANRGSWISVAAPGVAITSSVAGGGFGVWSGTSMAAPFVSGIAALVQAVNPHLAARDLARRIERSAMPLCDDKAEQADALAALFAVEPDSKQCR